MLICNSSNIRLIHWMSPLEDILPWEYHIWIIHFLSTCLSFMLSFALWWAIAKFFHSSRRQTDQYLDPDFRGLQSNGSRYRRNKDRCMPNLHGTQGWGRSILFRKKIGSYFLKWKFERWFVSCQMEKRWEGGMIWENGIKTCIISYIKKERSFQAGEQDE